jgi:1-acyl-sn-glycerol-3-phosphate acyltransferase
MSVETASAPISPATRFELAFYGLARAVFAGWAYTFWRIRVKGRANIPAEGAFVLAPVHRSNVDTILMACVSRRRLRYMAKDSLFKRPWSAWVLTALGGFPVRRGTADREALRLGEEAIRTGEALVIFPEGTRRSGTVVKDLFEGAAFIALRAGVPIIPVGIGNSEQAMPKGAKGLRPVKIGMVIGAPIVPPAREPGGRGSRRQVHELTERLETELQALMDEAEAAAHGKRRGIPPAR